MTHEAIRKALAAAKNAEDPFCSMQDYRLAVDLLASCGATGLIALLADRDRLAAALKGMQRFWGKYPEWVHAPELLEQACQAVAAMNSAIDTASPEEGTS